MNVLEERTLMRRVAGHHNVRLDGMGDLLLRAPGASVMDIGCNRGMVAYDFALNGATTIHGCDIDKQCILVAREWYADLRAVESKFEDIDLSKGPSSLAPFGNAEWDIVLMLATYHKIKRVMEPKHLSDLIEHFGARTKKFFAWRGTSEKANENEGEMFNLDRDLKMVGLKRIHTSYLSQTLGVAAIWARL